MLVSSSKLTTNWSMFHGIKDVKVFSINFNALV